MNMVHKTLSTSTLEEAVLDLIPLIEAHAETAEANRQPVDSVIAAIAETGLFRAFVPRQFGGYELDLDRAIDLGLAISKACTSTGWVSTFYMEHNWMLAQFPVATQETVLAERGFILAPASISPGGRARQVSGGYRLSGRWGWGTGIMHADWVFLNGVVENCDDEPRLFLVRRDAVEVLDTWYCSGMSGTGSNDIRVEDIFVPAAYSEGLAGMSVGRGSGAEALGSPSFRFPMMPLLCLAAAIPALGAGQKALELFQARLQERKLYGMPGSQAQRPSAQTLLANSKAQLSIAETVLRETANRLQAWGERTDVCPRAERAELRLLVGHAVRGCRDVVRDIMAASGAGAHLSSHPMQRVFRDINTLSCHTVFDLDIGAENYGRLLLGMEPASPV